MTSHVKVPFVLLTAAAVSILGSALRAEEAPNRSQATATKAEDRNTSFEKACLAAELALAGEQQQSPAMLLAAAEILMELQQTERPITLVEVQLTGADGDSAEAGLPSLNPDALIARAKQLGADAAVAESLGQRSRGLVYRQGKDLPKEKIGGVTYVLLNTEAKYQRLDPNDVYTLTNVIFEGEKPAAVGVIGDGDGDLDLWVYDGNNDALIGEDVDTTSRCVVTWTTRYEGPFTIKVKNVGSTWERFYVLANW